LNKYFSGLIPRWLLEIATIIISNVLVHLLKSQLPTQNEMVPMYEYMAAVSLMIKFKRILNIYFIFSLLLKLLLIH
jgi:hypothetical protein